MVPGLLSPHFELVPPLLHGHPHVSGEDAVEDADDAALADTSGVVDSWLFLI